MPCTDDTHTAPCSCSCLTADELVRIILAVALGFLGVRILLACPVLFVALPVLACLYCAGKLVLDMLWTGTRWLGHYVLGLPAPVDHYAVVITRRPLAPWKRYALWAYFGLCAAGLVAVAVLGG